MSIDNENELEFTEEENQSKQPAVETPVEESTEPVEYTPNYNYSVKDEEFEFDERLRTAVTSKEAEDTLRDLYTKSAGLDTYKGKYSELEQQTNALVSGYNTLKELRDAGDIRGLAKALNMKEDTFIQFAGDILDERELPEEQRKLLEENRQMREQMSGFESQLNQFQQSEGTRKVDSDIAELETLIVSESYKPVAEAMKSVGISMQEKVMDTGIAMYHKTGKEPSVEEVVAFVAKEFDYLTKQATDKPVLPSVKSSGSTAIGKKITSIDDLRKLRASL